MNAADRHRVVLAGVVFAVLLAQVQLYPGVPDLVEALGATTDLDASMWFLAAELTAYVLFAGVWGALSDATGRRVPFIAAGGAGASLGYLALAAVPSLGVPFGGVLALRVLQGAATVGALSLAMTMLMDLRGGHGRNMGAAGIAIGLGVGLGAPIGGHLTTVGPLYPLYVASGFMALVAGAVLLVPDRAPGEGRGRFREVVDGFSSTPVLAIPYAFGFVDRLTAGFFSLVGTFYFRQVFELDAAATGLTLALFFGPFALLQYPFGKLSDRIGRTIPIVVGSVSYGLAIVAIGLAGDLGMVRGLMVLIGVLGALVSPATMALVTDLAGDLERGTAMAGFNVAGSLGFLAGILLGGTVADAAGYPAAFGVVGALEMAVVLVALPALLRLDVPAGPVAPSE